MRQVLSVVVGLAAWFAAFSLLLFVLALAASAFFGPVELAVAAALTVPVGIWAGRSVSRRSRPA